VLRRDRTRRRAGDHEHREAERPLQRLDQGVELTRCDGVEAGGRLIEKEECRIECERARQRHALGHAAGQLRGEFVAVLGRQADQLQLRVGDLVEQRFGEMRGFAQRKLDVLPRIQRGEQRALLEQHAAATGVRFRGGWERDLPASLGQQPDKRAHQDRLAAAGGADQAKDFA